ncbi:UNVERIFIED_ORG: hypothetical protein M2442_001396 [Methylorubrum zatmanii]|nr:hypothetical protein [Methylorubrum zatmanii]
MHALDPLGATEVARSGEAVAHVAVDQAFDLEFEVVVELEAIGAEQLNAVILVRVV